MNQQTTIDEIAARIARLLPQDTGQLGQDLRKNIRAALGTALARMDLVTREEFDVQSELLARTRTRLEALEKQVAEMERDQG